MFWITVTLIALALLFAVFHKRRDRWERPIPPRPRPAVRLDEVDRFDKE